MVSVRWTMQCGGLCSAVDYAVPWNGPWMVVSLGAGQDIPFQNVKNNCKIVNTMIIS